jgi:hypothetical protein
MRKNLYVMSAIAAMAAFTGCSSGSSTGGFDAEATYVLDLTTTEVVPAPKPTSATGAAAFIVYRDRIEYQIAAQFIPGVTAVHIHSGAPGATGNEVVTLFSASSPISPVGAFATGAMLDANLPTGVTLASVKALMASGNAYVDVHTTSNASGELRGQIR